MTSQQLDSLQKTLIEAMNSNTSQLRAEIAKTNETLESIRTELTEMKSSISSNTANIDQLKQKLLDTESGMGNNLEDIRKRMAAMEQQALAPNIILKGFPSNNFSVKAVVEKLRTHFELAGGIKESYMFSREYGHDDVTKRPKISHMMAVTLTNTDDKNRIFQKLNDEGHLVLKNLLESADDEGTSDTETAKTPIYIENKLTYENLRIKKRLLELKIAGVIAKFFMRSGLFVIEQPVTMATQIIHSMEMLDWMFPLKKYPKPTKQQRERPRQTTKRKNELSPTTNANEAHVNKKMSQLPPQL